jgi:protein-tyrosine phosphatase
VNVEDEDEEPIHLYFKSSFDFIENALTESPENKVLVHCAFGVSRSATIIVMFLMKHYRLEFEDAMEHVQ